MTVAQAETTALEAGYAGCHGCLKPSPLHQARCDRCGTALHARKRNSLERTLALLLAAMLLYVPANVLPITSQTQLGSTDSSTIMGSVIALWHHGDYPIAALIFVASVLVPLSKIAILLHLCWAARFARDLRPARATWLYRATEAIGRWSMIDVFVVAILVALVQLGDVLSFRPGSAALSFCLVVILTMLAAESYDPRLLWDRVRTP